MNHQQLSNISIARTLIVAAGLLLGNLSLAETVNFRVAFEWVPGTAEIEAGNLQAGIKVLEYQLANTDLASSGDILATLCAAHIVNASMDRAKRVCENAVDISPTTTAYNNRGVYRVHAGDLSGAREDFERARPSQLDTYLEALRITDVPLMAADNFDLVDQLMTTQTAAEADRSIASSTAAIESLID